MCMPNKHSVFLYETQFKFPYEFVIAAAATLSNVLRCNSTCSKNSLKLLENKNVTQFICPKMNIAPVMVSVVPPRVFPTHFPLNSSF